ncbi:hypothetical protein ACWOAQ_05640 [Helcococcus kunzii]|uniref:Arylsulfotransferase N-terminal domain-containing protein n=1 Tax=Helcococcus kunzii ATCC 51366 TaxID=883114 RepID=H3NL14_9FIRM|nr:hypothetical protein [Helcococcus kunzii]EHR36270.1 hypothetical protein HMPREF9709_00025 [Helcococcus kunzii ATCC 51366]QUY65715.1 hypothetical protein GUI37_09375 [Helcococcus kunzii]
MDRRRTIKRRKRKINLNAFRILLIAILALVLFFVIKIYQFNNLDSKVETFNVDFTKETNNIGVLNNKYYKIDNGVFSANTENGEQFKINVLDINKVIYDKYIYLVENSGRIRLLNRNDGKELKKVKLDKSIESIEKNGDNLIVYHPDKVSVLSDKLEKVNEVSDLRNPIKYDFTDTKEAILEMDLSDGVVSSIFTVKNNDNTQFSISSSNEVFLFTKIIDDNTIMVSNSYIYLINGNSVVKKILLKDISAIDFNYEQLAVVDDKQLIIFDKNLEEIDKKTIGVDADKLSIRKNSIVAIGNEKLFVYENGNVIDADIGGVVNWFENDQVFYTIFLDKIVKVNAY